MGAPIQAPCYDTPKRDNGKSFDLVFLITALAIIDEMHLTHRWSVLFLCSTKPWNEESPG